jgi:hypothetical protein
MSWVSPNRQLIGDSFLAASCRGASPALRARALAHLRRAILDQRLATKCDRHGGGQSAQMTPAQVQEQLATALEALLLEADNPPAKSAEAAVCREEINVARGEIRRVVARLRDPRPVRPRGAALAQRLLSDTSGPLYTAGPNDELYRRLRRIADALD